MYKQFYNLGGAGLLDEQLTNLFLRITKHPARVDKGTR